MRLLAFVAALLWLSPAAATPPSDVDIQVSRAAAGDWLVEYRFRRHASLWFFQRSNFDNDGNVWRRESFQVETPGVRLERVGNYDVLASDRGRPLRTVRIRMRPFAHPLRADYTPALRFSDGGLALYSDHFLLMPARSRDQVAALPIDLSGAAIDEIVSSLTVSDPGRRLLIKGRTHEGRAAVPLDRGGVYIYSGDAAVIENESFAGVLDPGLPAWVRTELDSFTPRLMRLYTERLGPPRTGRPMALVAWQGAERPGYSMGGSVLDGMVVMQISGQEVLQPTPAILSVMRWFIGHESAHFWMGQTVSYGSRNDGWITEGSSQLLAIRGFAALDPAEDALAREQAELDECLALNSPGEPLATAEERGEHRAFYSCGAMLFRVAEAVTQRRAAGSDVFTFVRALIDANRADGLVGLDDWLAAFEAQSGDPALAGAIRDFVTRGTGQPVRFWRELLGAVGVPVAEQDGKLRLLRTQPGSAATSS